MNVYGLEDRPPVKIYVASKAKHGDMWKSHRAAFASGNRARIISTWIDECGEGESDDMTDLWLRCIVEVAAADILVAYYEPGDVWKGAFVEIGAALAHGKRVYVIGDPPGSWVNHPLVKKVERFHDAIEQWRAQ